MINFTIANLIASTKWKFDYIIFKKNYDSVYIFILERRVSVEFARNAPNAMNYD